MPDKRKNALNINAPEAQSTPDLKNRYGQATVTFSLWTVSGIVLAACGGGSSSGDPISVTSGPVLGIGIDGASAGLPPTKEDSIVLVHDGTVKGAAVYFDTDGDGMVSEEEKEAQRDDEGNPVYITDEEGQVTVPEQLQNRLFVVDVNDAPVIVITPELQKDYAADGQPALGDLMVTLREGETAVIGRGDIGVYDPDHTDEDIIYTITQLVFEGSAVSSELKLQINTGTALEPEWMDLGQFESFDLSDVTGGRIRVIHNGANPHGDTDQYDFKFTVQDADGGALDEQTVTLTVTGIDDAPILSMASVDVEATEKGGTSNNVGGDTASGKFAVQDEDGNGGVSFASDLKVQGRAGTSGNFTDGSNTDNSNKGAAITGTYGTLYLKADGNWTYEIDETHADVQALRPSSNALVDIFSVKTQNGHRDSNIITLRLSVNGANDAPTLRVKSEASDNAGTGTFTIGDVDGDDTETSLDIYATAGTAPVNPTDRDTAISLGSGDAQNATNIEGTYGTFTLTRKPDGDVTWTYALRNDDPDTEALATGESATDQVKLIVQDGDDANSSVLSATVNITGTNDAPRLTVSAASDNAVIEAGHNGTGEIVARDPDAGTGTFTIADVDGDDTVTSLEIYATAGTAPVNPTDRDTAITLGSGDAQNATNIEGTYGTFTLTRIPDGDVTWTYALRNDDPDTEALAAGESATDQVKLIVQDGDDATSSVLSATVNITGTNDKPEVIKHAYSKINVAQEDGVAINTSGRVKKQTREGHDPDIHLFDGETADHNNTIDREAGFFVSGAQFGKVGDVQGHVTISLSDVYQGGVLKIYLPEVYDAANRHEGTSFQFRKNGQNVGEEFTITGVEEGYNFFEDKFNFGVFTFGLEDQSLKFNEVFITFVRSKHDSPYRYFREIEILANRKTAPTAREDITHLAALLTSGGLNSTNPSSWQGKNFQPPTNFHPVSNGVDKRASHLLALTDGNKSSSSALDYQFNPINTAHEATITFDFGDRQFTQGQLLVYNRVNAHQQLINGSTIKFYLGDDQVGDTVTLNHTNENNNSVIRANLSDQAQAFDRVVLEFDGGSQNLREIEILGLELEQDVSINDGLATIDENTNVRTDIGSVLFVTDLDTALSDFDPSSFNVFESEDSATASTRFDIEAVDAATGEYKIVLLAGHGSTLDYETQPNQSIDLWIQVSDGAASSNPRQKVNVKINNVNDNAPAINVDDSSALTIDEGHIGADTDTGITLTADDADGGTPTWTLSDARFQVANGKLEIVSGSSFDYEDADIDETGAFTLTVTAVDTGIGAGTSAGNASETVKIKIGNRNDSPPVIMRKGEQFTLIEDTFNTPTNTGYTFTAIDADGGTPRLSLSGDDRFEIDGGNLRIKKGSIFDYEQGDQAITLTITAVDTGIGSGSSPGDTSETVVINIANRSDHAPVIKREGTQLQLLEGEINVTTETGYRFTASDADGGNPILSVSGDNLNRFEIDSEGYLQVRKGSIFDVAGHITLTISAADTDMGEGSSPDATQEVIIVIDIVNKHAPEITLTGTSVLTIKEGNIGTDTDTGFRLTAFDDDGGNPTWEFSDHRFQIANGKLQIKEGSRFDYEHADIDESGAFTLTVTAVDSGIGVGTSPGNASETVKIKFNNVNDNKPVITRKGTASPLLEDTNLFPLSGKKTGFSYTAIDADGGAPTFTVSGDDRFEIDADGDLRIKTGSTFDYEQGDQAILLTITAADTGEGSGPSPGDTSETVVINIANRSDNAPVILREGEPVELREDTFQNATDTGYTYAASDPDGGTSRLSVSGDNRFEIVGGNLRIKAGEKFDYEDLADRSIILTITAADSDRGIGSSPDTTQQVTINFGNRNDNAPVIERAVEPMEFQEDTFQNATDTGYTYAARDPDGGSSSLSISGDDRFEIVGGNLRIKQGSSFDYEDLADRFIDLTITATDSGIGSGSSPEHTSETVTIIFDNVNEHAPVMTREGEQAPLTEGRFQNATDTGYSYVAVDADGGDPVLTVSGDDRFVITDGRLQIKAGSRFDYENLTDRSIDLTITAADTGLGSGSSPGHTSETVTIIFDNKNDNKPVLSRKGELINLTERTFQEVTDTGITYTASDADGGTSALTVSGGGNRFQIVGGVLQIKEGAKFDYENTFDRFFSIAIAAHDSGVGSGPSPGNSFQGVTFRFKNANDHAPVIMQEGEQVLLTTGSFDTATDTGYIFSASDADGGDPVLTVSGDDRFEIVDGHLEIRAGSVFEYEKGGQAISLTITAADTGEGVGSSPDTTQDVTIMISEGTPPLINLPKDSGGTIVQILGTDGADGAITDTAADEVVQGGNENDNINIAGGNDILIGGYGADTITLGDGAETVIYRFDSDSNADNEFRAVDGGDVINNFEAGVDKLVLVDVVDKDGVNAITSFADFADDPDKPTGFIFFDDNINIRTINLEFLNGGLTAGTSGDSAGTTLQINLKTPVLNYSSNASNFTGFTLKNNKYSFLETILGGEGSIHVIDDADLPLDLTFL